MAGFYVRHFSASPHCDGGAYLLYVAILPSPPQNEGSYSFNIFNIFLVKIMQKALAPVNSSENDCFADDAVEEVGETDTPLSSVSIG